MLFVDDDQPQPAHRREDRRARADDDARSAACDPLTLVAPLRLGQRRVQDRHALAEAGPEAPDGLRRERDLGDEDDRAQPALEGRGTRLQVDLGLPGACGAEEQQVGAARVDRLDDAVPRGHLCGRELRGLALARERLALCRRRLLLAALRRLGRDQRQCARRRRAVVVGDPERELDQRGRDLADHSLDRAHVEAGRRLVDPRDDDPARAGASERDPHDRPDADAVVDLVREFARDGPRRHERIDRGEAHYAGCSCSRRES